MRKKIAKLAYLFLLFVVLSCKGVSSETYSKASTEICNCIKNKNIDTNKRSSNELNYALCAQEIELKFEIDVTDKNFENALKENCPVLLKTHLKLTQNSISL